MMKEMLAVLKMIEVLAAGPGSEGDGEEVDFIMIQKNPSQRGLRPGRVAGRVSTVITFVFSWLRLSEK